MKEKPGKLKLREKIINLFKSLADIKILKTVIICTVILLSLGTRFLIPIEPDDGLVFDEAYFVPQVESYVVNRYFFDIHPPLAKAIMYVGLQMFNPDASELLNPDELGNRVSNYTTPLNLEGIRFFPRVFGSILPLVIFYLVLEILTIKYKKENRQSLIIAGIISLMAVFETTLIVESRFALPGQFLLVFVFSTLLFAFKYLNADNNRKRKVYFIFTSILFGLSLATKWLALALLPVLFIILFTKEYSLLKSAASKTRKLISKLFDLALLATTISISIYLGIFFWHFSMLKEYSPAAYEVAPEFISDLQNGTNTVSTTYKIYEWHRIALEYNKKVPKLDFNKPDEIGSLWVTWPIMARPIFYFWTTTSEIGEYAFIYLVGNPANWILSLSGIVGMITIFFVTFLKRFRKHLKLYHLLLILLFVSNYLPYALISRVMYLYHYLPALIIGFICFGIILDEIFGIIGKNRYKALIVLTIFVLISVTFWIYKPFAYQESLNESEFKNRVLIDAWNMRWPGDIN